MDLTQYIVKKLFHPLSLGVFSVLLAVMLSGCGGRVASVAESDETIHNWHKGREYQAAGRYELAREHYLLAMAAVRSEGAQQSLSRELATVDLMLRTLR